MLANDILLLKITEDFFFLPLYCGAIFHAYFFVMYVNNLYSDLLIFASFLFISNLLFPMNYSSSLLSARLKAFKMSLEQVEVVTKLLRASRTCNELVLKDCFKEILENGITSKELNSTDKSGRVSDSVVEKCETFSAINKVKFHSLNRAIYLHHYKKNIKSLSEKVSVQKFLFIILGFALNIQKAKIFFS